MDLEARSVVRDRIGIPTRATLWVVSIQVASSCGIFASASPF
jgi:hypothetical protein